MLEKLRDLHSNRDDPADQCWSPLSWVMFELFWTSFLYRQTSTVSLCVSLWHWYLLHWQSGSQHTWPSHLQFHGMKHKQPWEVWIALYGNLDWLSSRVDILSLAIYRSSQNTWALSNLISKLGWQRLHFVHKTSLFQGFPSLLLFENHPNPLLIF